MLSRRKSPGLGLPVQLMEFLWNTRPGTQIWQQCVILHFIIFYVPWKFDNVSQMSDLKLPSQDWQYDLYSSNIKISYHKTRTPQNFLSNSSDQSNIHVHDDVIKGKHFRVTSPLWGESTGYRCIPLTKASNIAHLRRHCAAFCVTLRDMHFDTNAADEPAKYQGK